ncbi:hypothetical protein PSEUBRA_002244 [Kalmanozyma brasiliensis GHG001]|uniref:Uncharacterized protein n=1 Tax=Kalmanozyma brasiliensis (strain GHG001) TaxID=1365824 RepID=V5EZ94_KALBG|nr:uncharacterized protein PSEUBRA_002244 [Kalmanozyma brasiliensis GHG001]EST08159.1 hypothetical protein PSEUBRA_002244 [Kalmanozyma brasiliensis GHG001]
MSASIFARQPMLLRSQARTSLCLVQPTTLRIGSATPALAARSLHTTPAPSASASNRRWPLKTLSGGLVVAGSGLYYLQPDAPTRSFSVHSPLESSEKPVTGSSTLVRPASPSAPRRQTVTLVFLTSSSSSGGLVKSLVSNFGGGGGEREKWFPWIGYFREAGYDCLQMNLALPPQAEGRKTEKLADELHSQIRLSNLQRQPVLFVHHSADSAPEATASIVSQYIEPGQSSGGGGGLLGKIFGGGGMFGGRPAISGLVVISDLDDASALTLFGKHPKLNTLIVANGGAKTSGHQGKVTVLDAEGKKHESIIKDIERWLIKEGYEG